MEEDNKVLKEVFGDEPIELKGAIGPKGVPGEPGVITLKRTRAKVEKNRDYDTLDLLDPKKMTDKERISYILELREVASQRLASREHMQDMSNSAFERARLAEADAKHIADQANLKLTLIKDNIRLMSNNIMAILER